jgi:hypothetical protein
LFAALACFYQSIDASVTAEEGMRYSIPGMQGDKRYSEDHIKRARIEFQESARSGDRWGDLFAIAFLASVASGITGYMLLRSCRPTRLLDEKAA